MNSTDEITEMKQKMEKIEKYECSICYEIIQKINNCTTPCGHSFCFNCIVKCLHKDNKCPYCRFVLNESKLEENDSNSDSENEEEGDDNENEELLFLVVERFEKKDTT